MRGPRPRPAGPARGIERRGKGGASCEHRRLGGSLDGTEISQSGAFDRHGPGRHGRTCPAARRPQDAMGRHAEGFGRDAGRRRSAALGGARTDLLHRHDQGRNGPKIFQSGSRVRLWLQSLGGAARVPGSPKTRSGMRNVLLGRGARAWPEHQLADGGGGDRPRLQGSHRGAAAGAERQRQGAGADRGARQALRRRTSPPTASPSTSPTRMR